MDGVERINIMERYVIGHRPVGEPNAQICVFYVDAENIEDAEQQFAEAHEDLNYFIEFKMKANPEGILYWVYFKETNLFRENHEQKMGLRVPENKSVYSAFDEYWEGWNLRITDFSIAPAWLQ
jgi:hypothetical protein